LVVDFDTTVNSSPTDISGKGNHGVLHDAAYYSAADKAFKFDGIDDVLHVDSATGLPTGDAIYTLSCWIKTGATQTTSNPSLFYFGSAWNTSVLAGIYLRGGNKVAHDIGSTNVSTTNLTITPEKWHHVVVVKRGTGNIGANTTYQGIFVDGVEITQLSLNGSPRQQTLGSGNMEISVGHHFSGTVGSGGDADGFKGCVSKPQIWNVALEASEVKKLYNLGRTGRSMVISDTAVGIGKVPEAQLDVRGNLGVSGHITNSGPRLEICDDSTHVHGYGTVGKGVKFSHAGIVFDRTWGNYPSLGVFTKNIDGTTNQGEFRIHGFDVSYSSYPGPSGEADFGVVTRCDGGYQSGSDRRMKINITTIDEALKKVCLLTGKRYQLINRNGDINKNTSQNGYNYGFIAQDIEESGIDEIYKHNEHEDDKTENYNSAYSINYDSIIPILINAIKEIYNELQAEKVVTTENKDLTRELRIENNRLKSKVAILENRQTHFNTLLVNLIGRVETLERPA